MYSVSRAGQTVPVHGGHIILLLLYWFMAVADLGAAVERKDLEPLYREGTDTVVLRYSIQVPRGATRDRPLPIMVLFHGTNLDAKREVTWTDEVLQVMGLRDQVILLAPQGGQGRGPWQGRADDIRYLIDWAKSSLPMDHRRMVFAGFSAGGGFIMDSLITQHRTELAGAISFAGNSGLRIDRAQEEDPDIILIMGTDDNHQLARQWTKRSRSRGYRVVYREIIGAGHGTVLGLPNTRESLNRRDLITWALGQRCRAIAPNHQEVRTLHELAHGRGRPNPAQMAEVARIGGSEAGALVGKWLTDNDRGMRLAAARMSQTTLFDGVTVPGLIRVAMDDDFEVAHAAAIALGHLASWGYSDAQLALVQLTRSAQPQHRGVAAVGLKHAISFIIYGQHEYGSQFVALTDLMADGDAAVRKLAWEALSREMPPINPKADSVRIAQPRNFDPNVSPQAQPEVISRWRSWANGLPEQIE